jgi:deoxyribonuclease-4
MNSRKEWEDLIKKYENYLGGDSLHAIHIHLSGIEYSSKGERNHLPIRDSDMNVTDLFKTLKDAGCSGRILCESPIMEEDSLFMKSLWESL